MKKLLTGLLLSLVLSLGLVTAVVLPSSSADFIAYDGCDTKEDISIAGFGGAWIDGNYGGLDESDFCLVWEIGCDEEQDTAKLELYFPEGPQLLRIRHLDGISDLDSFNVYVGGDLVGTYTDSMDSVETWVITDFPVDVTEGSHSIALEVIDPAWASCDMWGQLAIDWIDVVPDKDDDVPEFTIVGALAVLGIAGIFIARRR